MWGGPGGGCFGGLLKLRTSKFLWWVHSNGTSNVWSPKTNTTLPLCLQINNKTALWCKKQLEPLMLRHKVTWKHCWCEEKFVVFWTSNSIFAGPSGRAVACWDCGFESHRGHGCLSVVSVVCCQVEVSATSWSLVQRSPTDCGASLCVI